MNTPNSQLLVASLQALWGTHKLFPTDLETKLEIENIIFRQLPQAIDEDLGEIDDGKKTSGNGVQETTEQDTVSKQTDGRSQVWRRSQDTVHVLWVYDLQLPRVQKAPAATEVGERT